MKISWRLVLLLFSLLAVFAHGTDVPVFCPAHYTLYNGRCFGVHDNKLEFPDAEVECNKLPGGHLTAFRSLEEWNFVKHLTRNSRETWVGLTNYRRQGCWMFTDGSPNIIDLTRSNGPYENCSRITNDGSLADNRCSQTFRYTCMLDALANLTFEDETKDEYVNIMDLNTESCVDGQTLLRKMDHYRVDLVIPQKIENGINTVYFNQTVDCNGTQVMNTWKYSSRCQGKYLKPCQLTESDVITTSCQYTCLCDGDGCQIALLDYRDKGCTGYICEVTYGI